MRLLALAGMVLLLAGTAAAYPDEERAILEVGSSVVDLVVSDDDRLVGVACGDGMLRVIDTADVHAAIIESAACDTVSGISFGRVEEMPRFYLSCADGTVAEIELDTSVIPAVVSQSFVIDVGTAALDDVAVSTTEGRLFTFEDTGSEYLYHVVDLDSGTTDVLTGWPITGMYAVVSMTTTPLGTYVVAANDQGRVTKLVRSGDLYTIASYDLLGLSSFVDVAAMDESYAYFLEGSGSLVQYFLTADNDFSYVSNSLGSVTAFTPVQAEGLSYFYVMDSAGTVQIVPAVIGADVEATITLGRDTAGDLASASEADSRVYAGLADGGVSVISGAPWVEITSVDPAQIYEGQSTQLTFTVDEDCSYNLFLGGDIDQSGSVLAGYSGTASAGDTKTLTVGDGDLQEGDNRLFVFASAGGLVGRDSDTVALDTPPDVVSGFEVGFGNEKLTIRWIATDETDIDHYLVYFADQDFDESSGAPEFQVEGPGVVIESPARTDAGEPGDSLSYTLEYLTNGVEYCVAVAGLDSGGQEGPWTETLCESPELTIGSGDGLGYCGSCGVVGRGGAVPRTLALLAVLAGLLGACRASALRLRIRHAQRLRPPEIGRIFPICSLIRRPNPLHLTNSRRRAGPFEGPMRDRLLAMRRR